LTERFHNLGCVQVHIQLTQCTFTYLLTYTVATILRQPVFRFIMLIIVSYFSVLILQVDEEILW